jgi:hypothetical protein
VRPPHLKKQKQTNKKAGGVAQTLSSNPRTKKNKLIKLNFKRNKISHILVETLYKNVSEKGLCPEYRANKCILYNSIYTKF